MSLSAVASVQSSSQQPVVRYRDGAHCIAWVGNVELILSREAPTSQVMRTIVAELDSLAKVCREGTGALLIVNSDCPPPDEAARSYIRAELARSSMLAAVQVVEGTGFRGAAMRAVLSVLQLALRPPFPMHITGNLDEGARFLCDELKSRAKVAPNAAHLVHTVRALQASAA
jgi:hypothetical protein